MMCCLCNKVGSRGGGAGARGAAPAALSDAGGGLVNRRRMLHQRQHAGPARPCSPEAAQCHSARALPLPSRLAAPKLLLIV